MKIKDIIEKFGEDERKEIETTIDACMESICCKDVQWREFSVYDSSCELLEKALKNMFVEFLLPIAEEAKDESDREIIILCSSTKKKEDEIWFIRVNPVQIYAMISFSAKTTRYLSKN